MKTQKVWNSRLGKWMSLRSVAKTSFTGKSNATKCECGLIYAGRIPEKCWTCGEIIAKSEGK